MDLIIYVTVSFKAAEINIRVKSFYWFVGGDDLTGALHDL